MGAALIEHFCYSLSLKDQMLPCLGLEVAGPPQGRGSQGRGVHHRTHWRRTPPPLWGCTGPDWHQLCLAEAPLYREQNADWDSATKHKRQWVCILINTVNFEINRACLTLTTATSRWPWPPAPLVSIINCCSWSTSTPEINSYQFNYNNVQMRPWMVWGLHQN